MSEKDNPANADTERIRISKRSAAILVTVLILLNILLAVVPTLSFDKPFSQFDGAYYYQIANAWVKGGYHSSVNSNVNVIDKVSDYPPGLITVYYLLIKYFGAFLTIVNGFYLAIMFVIGNFFLYLTVHTLTKDRFISLLVLAFSVLNLRAYYMLFSGIQPTFAGICIGYVGLYFFCKVLLDKHGKVDIFLAILFNCIVATIHTVAFGYLLMGELSIYIGYFLNKTISLELPTIKLRYLEARVKHLMPLLLLVIPIIITVISFKFYVTNTSSNSFLGSWISMQMSDGEAGYQTIWGLFLLFDGPLLYIFSHIGMAYLFYKKKWIPFCLAFGGWLFIASQQTFFHKPIWLVHYIHSYFTVWTVVMAISAAYIFRWFLRDEKLRKIGIALIVLSLTFQAAKVGYFVSSLTPAITDGEIQAVDYMVANHHDGRVLFFDNIDESGWRAFIWVPVLSNPKYHITVKTKDALGDALATDHFDTVYVGDNTKITPQEEALLVGMREIYDAGGVSIYSPLNAD